MEELREELQRFYDYLNQQSEHYEARYTEDNTGEADKYNAMSWKYADAANRIDVMADELGVAIVRRWEK